MSCHVMSCPLFQYLDFAILAQLTLMPTSSFHTLCPYAQTHPSLSLPHTHIPPHHTQPHTLFLLALTHPSSHLTHSLPFTLTSLSLPHTHAPPSYSLIHTPTLTLTHTPPPPLSPSSCEERLTNVKCPVLRLVSSTTSDWEEQLWSQCTGKLECKTLNLI